MAFYVYLIHNIVNNKVYVGKTPNPKERWRIHQYNAKQKNTRYIFYIHRAIAKYGIDAFTFSVMQSFVQEDDCLAAEKYWIKFFQSRNPEYGYNMTDGGEGATGRVVSAITRKKIGDSSRGKHLSPETKEKIAEGLRGEKNYLYGKHISSEARAKMSAARMGKYAGEENPTAKLTWKQVREIRELRKQPGNTLKILANKFHVSTTNISDICNNKIWKENK